MLESVQKYFDAKEAADAARNEAIEEANVAYSQDRTSVARVLRDQRSALADTIRSLAHTEAWVALTESDDPLVKYIAVNFSNQKTYAEPVLRQLPATAAQLRAFRAAKGWCSDFNYHLNEAVGMGVVVNDLTPQRRDLDDWLTNNLNGSYGATLMDLVNAVVESEKVTAPDGDAEPTVADLTLGVEAALARVDTVWAQVRALAPETIDRDSAEHLFRQAVLAVVTGESEMFEGGPTEPESDEAE
jgi:hypothetical protein